MGRNLVLNEYFASVLRNRNNFSAFNINLFAAVMPDGFKDYTRFTELLTRELESKVKIVGKVLSADKIPTRTNTVQEFCFVDQEMEKVKVTVFGEIPKQDRSGLRKGCVAEVGGVIKEKDSVRYVQVGYTKKGHWITALPKDDPRTQHILARVGRKRKSKGDISQPTNVKTIKQLKESSSEGSFQIQSCFVRKAFPNVYPACIKCKTKKIGDFCKKCNSKTKNKDALRINVIIADSSTREEDGVNAAMFGDIGVRGILGLSAKKFMEKSKKEQSSICDQKYKGQSFRLHVQVKNPKSWVIQQIEKE